MPVLTVGQVKWMDSVTRAKAKAANEGKLVLLHFTGANCRPCQQLETFVYTNEQLAQKIHKLVVPVKVKSETQEKIFREYSVTSMPTDVVITPDGATIVKRSSPKTVDNYLFMLKRLDRLKKNTKAPAGDAKQKLVEEIRQLQKRDEKVRSGILADRKFQPNSSGQLYQPKNKTIKNQFVPGNERFQVQIENPNVPKINRPDHQFHTPKVNTPQVNTPQVQNLTQNTTQPPANTSGAVQQSIADNPLRPRKKRVSNPYVNSPTTNSVEPKSNLVAGQSGPVLQANPQKQDSNIPDFKPQKTGNKKVITNHFVQNKNELTLEKNRSTNLVNQSDNISPIQSVRPTKPAMDGYCPVTLMVETDWKKGDKQWGCYHRGKLFLFVSKEKRDRFLKSPEEFCPLLAGFDPVEFERTGKLIEGGIKTGVVFDLKGKRKMVLFNSEEAKAVFKKSPSRYLDLIEKANERTARVQGTEKNHTKLR